MMKAAIVTGTRAEYGLLKPLIHAIHTSAKYELQLIATAMHLSPEYGCTIDEIISDDYPIAKQVESLKFSDSSVGVSKSTALALSGLAEAYEELKPDILIILGDRTEILAAVIAATYSNIPIAHIHGGETTEGAYDEGVRHAITKFSHLHFTSSEPYRKRVIQLGEHPESVYNVGAIGIDSIKKMNLLSKKEFEKEIDWELNKKNILFTYHPVTLENKSPEQSFNEILKAIDELEDTNVIFTHANSDKNGRIINEMIQDYVSVNSNKAKAFISLGQLRYLSALQFVDVVVGNSSSGILEVPFFDIPTVNIGDRQKGRICNKSVIHAEENYDSINRALKKAFNVNFIASIKGQKQIFGNGEAVEKIMSVLDKTKKIDLKKSFFDIDFDYEV